MRKSGEVVLDGVRLLRTTSTDPFDATVLDGRQYIMGDGSYWVADVPVREEPGDDALPA